MTGSQTDVSLMNVLWSLVIELRISLIFPILYFLFKGRTKTAAVSAIALQFLCRYLEIRLDNFEPYFDRSWIEALVNIGYYIPFFIAGIIAWDNMAAIKRFVSRFHPPWSILGLLIALKLTQSGVDMLIGLAAFLIIILCVSSPMISRGLSVRPIEWLGRISYSLYLVHLTVLSVVFHLFYGKANKFVLSAVVVIGSLVLAQLFFMFVEEPSIQLGRKFTARKKIVPAVVA